MDTLNNSVDKKTTKKTSVKDAKGTQQEFYNIIKDGHGIPWKVVNFENPKVMKRTGIVVVETIKKHNRVEPRETISFVIDPQSKLVWGVVLGIDPHTKNIIWKRITLLDRREYNLSDYDDAVEWAIVKNAEFMKGSLWPVGQPKYQVFDKDAEAQIEIDRETIRDKAQSIYSSKLKLDDYMDIVRVVGGKNPRGMSAVQLQGEVIKIKNNNPQKFVEFWESSNREIYAIFEKCLAFQLIKLSNVGLGYMWKDNLPIGLTKVLAVDYLSKNPNVLSAAKQESENAQTSAMKYLDTNQKEVSFFTMDDSNVDSDVVELRTALAAMGMKDLGTYSKEELQKLYNEKTEN